MMTDKNISEQGTPSTGLPPELKAHLGHKILAGANPSEVTPVDGQPIADNKSDENTSTFTTDKPKLGRTAKIALGVSIALVLGLGGGVAINSKVQANALSAAIVKVEENNASNKALAGELTAAVKAAEGALSDAREFKIDKTATDKLNSAVQATKGLLPFTEQATGDKAQTKEAAELAKTFATEAGAVLATLKKETPAVEGLVVAQEQLLDDFEEALVGLGELIKDAGAFHASTLGEPTTTEARTELEGQLKAAGQIMDIDFTELDQEERTALPARIDAAESDLQKAVTALQGDIEETVKAQAQATQKSVTQQSPAAKPAPKKPATTNNANTSKPKASTNKSTTTKKPAAKPAPKKPAAKPAAPKPAAPKPKPKPPASGGGWVETDNSQDICMSSGTDGKPAVVVPCK